jgi:hypothetical protein
LRRCYEFECSLLSSQTLILIELYPVPAECDGQKCRIFRIKKKDLYADIDSSLTNITEHVVGGRFENIILEEYGFSL